MDQQEIHGAEEVLGYEFQNESLLVQCLTHASLVDSRLDSNERMEFLGDAVLGMVVCDYLFQSYEGFLEGEMTKIKSSVVSRRVCAEIADELRLDELVRIGKGMSNRLALPRSVMAAVYEAIIGAIYLDGGIDAARDFILRHIAGRIEQAASSGHQYNFKSVLQQAAQEEQDVPPVYILLDEQGPDHAKCFEICVELGARRFGSCWGPSKKQAEQLAALEALLEMGYAYRSESGEIRLEALGASPHDTGSPSHSG